jgi:hypothetical protein
MISIANKNIIFFIYPILLLGMDSKDAASIVFSGARGF